MEIKMRKKINLLLVIVFGILLGGCKGSDVNDPVTNEVNEVTIGALVSLTGNWSSLGITTKAALELSVEEINSKFLAEGSNLKFNLKIVDTKLDPEVAYSKTQELINDGVEIILGPQSSAELAIIKPLLDENNIFAVSMSSTAGALAVAGDHVLRICPDDKPEGSAISSLMWERGIRSVVAVYRDDDGNIGLKRSMTNSFVSKGGTVIDSIKYSNDDNITTNLIDQIVAKVSASSTPSETAIYLAGFDEITNIFDLARSNELLSSTLWFGSNGSAMSAALIANTDASNFANGVGFCSPLFALSSENESEWSSLFDSIEQTTQLKPDAYTFAAYDALNIAALAYQTVGSDYQFDNLLSTYISTSASYSGMTGLTELNSAGDRKYGNFTLLGVCGLYPSFEWKTVGSYNASTNQLIYTGCN
jgi:branched-chain amino acid transport system substrate-binding protein